MSVQQCNLTARQKSIIPIAAFTVRRDLARSGHSLIQALDTEMMPRPH
ncbi:hypothetical protein [Pantoea sp. B65]